MARVYSNLDLVIAADGEAYSLNVFALGPERGHASSTFAPPFSTLELENFRLKTRPARSGVRRLESPEVRLARSIGSKLFEATFTDAVRPLLDSTLAAARRRDEGVRLRVTVPPELSELPWEYLYSTDFARFLSVSSETLIVRYLPNEDAVSKLPVTAPLRILVVVATPRGVPPFDADGEYDKLKEALLAVGQMGSVTVDRLERGTWRALQQQLRRHAYHVVHFIGHGAFDEREHEGMLIFEGDDGSEMSIGAASLGAMLHDHRSLRLVVLNACEGGRVSATGPYSGVAQALVRSQVPAVIAMQTEISDNAAGIFAREFYGSLSDGYPVDAALGEARKALCADPMSVEWGTPALYTRWPTGELFELTQPSQVTAISAQETMGVPGVHTPVPALTTDGVGVASTGAVHVSSVTVMTPSPSLSLPRPGEVEPVPVAVTGPKRHWVIPFALLVGVFGINLGETSLETRWSNLFPDRGLEFASALHWFEYNAVFDNHNLVGAVPFYVYCYSAAYFFLFPLLGIAFAWAFARRSEPQALQTYSAAVAIDYLISLPFLIFFPVPERWAFPDADSILLSDLWSSALIDAFRPISALDNCFPSFHTSMTIVMLLCAYVYRARFRTAAAPLGTMIIVSTYGLGIHWIGDIISGIAVGVISVAIAYAIVHRRGRPTSTSRPVFRRRAWFGHRLVSNP